MYRSERFKADQSKFRKRQLKKLRLSAPIVEQEHKRLENQGHDVRDANLWLRSFVKNIIRPIIQLPRTRHKGTRINNDANETEIRLCASAIALECVAVLQNSSSPTEEIRAIAKQAGVLKSLDAAINKGQTWRARAVCGIWWRRTLRRELTRQTDTAFRAGALVRRGRSAYCGHTSVMHYQERQIENAKTLAALVAIPSGTGAPVSLKELADSGPSNPLIRRAELMTRISGFEKVAELRGDKGTFLTVTAPSRFHRFTGAGIENPLWNGETPSDAQAYLCNVWAKTRAKLARSGLKVYGFRVAEPHHDGCPHWHLFLFAPPAALDAIEAVYKSYALSDSPGEPGEQKHRFTAKRCDPTKGTAAGYIAKYISKNIDGNGITVDAETGQNSSKSALQVRAWASTWGVRQFQQIGGPPVIVWRELRRLSQQEGRKVESKHLEALVLAAKLGDWQLYNQLMGGPVAAKKNRPVAVLKSDFDQETGEIYIGKYGDKISKIIGLTHKLGQTITRLIKWVISHAKDFLSKTLCQVLKIAPATGPPVLA